MRAITHYPATFRTHHDLLSRENYVYILRCVDDSLYIGHTDDLTDRIKRHNEGRANCWYTINRRPVRLDYVETFPSRRAAVERERQLKRWSRRKKDALIRGDMTALKRL